MTDKFKFRINKGGQSFIFFVEVQFFRGKGVVKHIHLTSFLVQFTLNIVLFYNIIYKLVKTIS